MKKTSEEVQTYVKKPVEIEAIQLSECNTVEVLTFCNHDDIVASNEDGTISIKTLEGTMVANVGDYIIKGVKGELYPCKPDIFEETYNRVEKGVALERPYPPNFEIKLVPEEIANIALLLDNDPRMKKVEFDSTDCSLHFVVQYSGDEIIDGIKEAAFTIYEGTTIVRENGIYRTEHRNG